MKAIITLLLFFALLLTVCRERPIPVKETNCLGLSCLLAKNEDCKIDVYSHPLGRYGRKSETEQLPFQRANKKDSSSIYDKRVLAKYKGYNSAVALQWRTIFYAQKSLFVRGIVQLLLSCGTKFIPNRDKIYLNHSVFRL